MQEQSKDYIILTRVPFLLTKFYTKCLTLKFSFRLKQSAKFPQKGYVEFGIYDILKKKSSRAKKKKNINRKTSFITSQTKHKNYSLDLIAFSKNLRPKKEIFRNVFRWVNRSYFSNGLNMTKGDILKRYFTKNLIYFLFFNFGFGFTQIYYSFYEFLILHYKKWNIKYK